MDWSGLINGAKDFFYFIPQTIYFIIGCCLQGIDACQFLFRKIIGLDTYYYDGTVAVNPINFGDDSSGDLIMQIFKNVFLDENFSVLKIAFISLIILGSILLFITTIAAIIKVEYKPDDKAGNSKGKIIGNTLKAVGAFFAVPIICYFGIVLGNIALWGVDQATSPSNVSLSTVGAEITNKLEPSVTVVQEKSSGTTTRVVSYDYYSFFGTKTSSRYTPMSSIAMKISLMTSNKARIDDDFYDAVTGGGDTEDKTLSFDIFNVYAGRQNEKELTANSIDTVFMLNAKLKNPQVINDEYKQGVFVKSGTIEYFDRYDVGLVSYYYDLWYYMWPVALLFIMIVGKILIGILFGLIKRIYMVFALLLVSPIAISMWPLDGGKSIGDWRGKFTSEVFSAYGSVLALNLFYLIYPIIYSFSFFGSSSSVYSVLDALLQFFFVIAGMLAIKDIDGIVTGFFGGKSGFIDSGEKAMKDITDNAKKAIIEPAMTAGKITTGVAMGAGKMALGAGKMAYGAGRAGVNFAQSRYRKNSINRNTKNGSISDEDIANNVRGDVLNSRRFKNEINDLTNSSMDDMLSNYHLMGGQMEADQIAGLTGDAMADWGNMSDKQKQAFMPEGEEYNERTARIKYMHDRHALESALLGATPTEYNEEISKRFEKDFMNGKTGSWKNTVTYNDIKAYEKERNYKALAKTVDDTLKFGKPIGKFGQYTLNKKDDASNKRQKAIEKAEKSKNKLSEMETSSSMLKRYTLGGVNDIGSGIGKVFRTVAPPPKK